MRLIKIEEGCYVSAESILAVYTSGNMIFADDINQDEIKLGEYTTAENMRFALADLIRRLTEDHKLIEIMTNEQAAEELRRRSDDGRG